MNLIQPNKNYKQGNTEARKRANERMPNPPLETQQEFATDGPRNWALWNLSLILKEISENTELNIDDKQ